MATDSTSEAAHVGPSDGTRILLLLLLAAGLHAFTVANSTMPSRDCIVFVRDGLQLETPTGYPDRVAVLRGTEHPPGYPATIVAMSWFVRPLMSDGQPTVESMALSAQLVSSLSAVLLVIPLYLIARRLFDRNVAFAAVAIFQVLPVFVEVTSDGISDGLYLLTAAWGIWFAIRALSSLRSRSALLFGMGAGVFCGLSYLVRPDALVVALAIGLTCAGLVVRRIRLSTWRVPFCAGLGLTIATFGVMAPYCVTIGGITNKPTGSGIIKSVQGDETKPTFFRRESAMRPGVNLPLAAWWDPEANKDDTKTVWAAKTFVREFLKTSHYALPFLVLVGLWVHRRRLTEPGIAMLLTIVAVHSTILWFMAWKIDYVSQRHTLLSVMIVSILASSSFAAIGAWAVRCSPIQRLREWNWNAWKHTLVWTAIIMATALPRDFRSLHIDRAGHKAAGQWLAKNGSREITIADPFGWAEWYAGRTIWTWPTPVYTLNRDFYLIFEPNARSPHSRLNHYEFVRGLYGKESTEMIYQYPEDAPPDQIKVAVYYYHHQPAKK